jgi:hypothetical protein
MAQAKETQDEFHSADEQLHRLLNLAVQLSNGLGGMETGLLFTELLSSVENRLAIAGPECVLSTKDLALVDLGIPGRSVQRVSDLPTERDRHGLRMARSALKGQQVHYGDAYLICDLLLEKIDRPDTPQEPAYEQLAAMLGEQHWTQAKPTVPGAYYVRGFRPFEPDSAPALVEVAFDTDEHGHQTTTLVCNLHQANSDELRSLWRPITAFRGDFEWLGPLVHGQIDGKYLSELEQRTGRLISEARELNSLAGDLVEHESEDEAEEDCALREELNAWLDDCEQFITTRQPTGGEQPSTSTRACA